jgi:hypothetical protein
MAAAPVPMTPPPSAQGVPSGTSTPVAAPAPPEPNPQMGQGTNLLRQAMRNLLTLSKAFPTTAPIVQQIMPLMRDAASAVMEEQATPEPSAPPQG